MVSHPLKILEAQAKYKFSSYLYGLQHADVRLQEKQKRFLVKRAWEKNGNQKKHAIIRGFQKEKGDRNVYYFYVYSFLP